MLHKKEASTIFGIKQLMVLTIIILSVFMFHVRADASSGTIYNNSDINENCTIKVNQNKIILEGKTTDNVSSFYTFLWEDKFPPTMIFYRFTGSVSNGIYSVTLELPSKDMTPIDGIYKAYINLDDAREYLLIIVEYGVANASLEYNRTSIGYIQYTNYLSIGETYQYIVQVTGSDEEVAWSTSDESIASIDDQGKVTAIACGKVDVIAEINKNTAKATLTIDTSYKDYTLKIIGNDDITDIPDTGSASYATLFLVGAVLMAAGGIVTKRLKNTFSQIR